METQRGVISHARPTGYGGKVTQQREHRRKPRHAGAWDAHNRRGR